MDKRLTVGELRKALEGVPDELEECTRFSKLENRAGDYGEPVHCRTLWRNTRMKKTILTLLVAMMALMFSGCAGCDRVAKSIGSDVSGGLHRTVTVYSNTGEKIKEWNGKFDVSENDNEVYFDLNDKRVIIHGGIVIDEED